MKILLLFLCTVKIAFAADPIPAEVVCDNYIATKVYSIPARSATGNCPPGGNLSRMMVVTSINNGQSTPVIVQNVFSAESLNYVRYRESMDWSSWTPLN